jgi:hypothetical protein
MAPGPLNSGKDTTGAWVDGSGSPAVHGELREGSACRQERVGASASGGNGRASERGLE